MDILKFIFGLEGYISNNVPLKYGPVRGDINPDTAVYMAASEVVGVKSAAFVTLDASGNGTITDDTDTTVFGHLVAAAQTCSSTARGTVLAAISDPSAVYRIPVLQAATAGASAAAWQAILGKKLDLDIISSVQGLDADVSTRGHVIVVNQEAWKASVATYGDSNTKPNATTGCRWVEVRINPSVSGK